MQSQRGGFRTTSRASSIRPSTRPAAALKSSCGPPARAAGEAPETANRLSYDLVVVVESAVQLVMQQAELLAQQVVSR